MIKKYVNMKNSYKSLIYILACLFLLLINLNGQIVMDSVLAHYNFDSNMNDQSGNEFHLFSNGSFVSGEDGTPMTALNFDFNSEPLELDPELIFERDTYQIEIVFIAGAPGALLGMQEVQYPLRPNVYVSPLYISSEGKVRGKLWNGSRTNQNVSENNILYQWTKVIFERKGDSQSLYVNGELIGTKEDPISDLNMSFTQIGSAYLEEWPGVAQEVLWYNFFGAIDDFKVRVPSSKSSVNTNNVWSKDCKINVSPVPAVNFINLDSETDIKNISILDMIGNEVSEVGNFNNQQLTLKNLNPGQYFLDVKLRSDKRCLLKIMVSQ